MKKKIFKIFILILILAGLGIGGVYTFNYVKPMLVTGKIIELKGEIKYCDNEYILIIDENNERYKCLITENTYYQNNYVPTLKDKVVAIYDYDEKVLEKNENLDIKEVTIKRIYKQK